MAKYFIINNGLTTNICLWDGITQWQPICDAIIAEKDWMVEQYPYPQAENQTIEPPVPDLNEAIDYYIKDTFKDEIKTPSRQALIPGFIQVVTTYIRDNLKTYLQTQIGGK